mgnify:CR=1 FL=1
MKQEAGNMRRTGSLALCVALITCILSCSAPIVVSNSSATEESPWKKSPATPERLLVLVIDEFQDSFIQKYALKNFARFKENAMSFDNATVGHLSSDELTSHTVLTTGLLPKNLPYQDRIFRDSTGKLGAKGNLYSTKDLSRKQFERLLTDTAPTNLHARLKRGHRGDTFTIGNDEASAYALGSPYSDLLVTLGAPKKQGPLKGLCAPAGVDVPDYFLYPAGGRFFLNCVSDFPSGNRFILGNDPAHLGGDAWIADSILEVMKEESDWRAIFATTASVHESLKLTVQYGNEIPVPALNDSPIALPKILQTLDEQFGKILTTLEKKDLLKETLVVVTSSHGGQFNRTLWQSNFKNGVHIVGKLKNAPEAKSIENLPLELRPFIKNPKVDAISYDTSLKFYLNTKDAIEISKLAIEIGQVKGVSEVYARKYLSTGSQFIRTYRSKELQGPALEWAKAKNQDLLSTLAQDSSSDLIAFLFDETGYADLGGGGGAQKAVQQIPLMIWSPNLAKGSQSPYPIRLVDLNPVISRLMNLSIPSELNGTRAPVDNLVLVP